MGFFDNFRNMVNPEVESTFLDLRNNYYKGLCRFATIERIYLSGISFSDKKRIYNNQGYIKRLNKEILEKEQEERNKEEIIRLSELYPHAFISFCKKYIGTTLNPQKISMPGNRKSNREIRLERERKQLEEKLGIRKFVSYSDKLNYSNRHYTIEEYDSSLVPSSVKDLSPCHVNLLLKYKNNFQKEENRIKNLLQEEDIRIKFDDEVLENPKRSKHYNDFLELKKRKSDDKKYIVDHLSDLDAFILNNITHIQYLKLEGQWPKGIEYYKRIHRTQNEEKILKDKETVVRYHLFGESYDNKKEWESKQIEFARFCHKIAIDNWGDYKYQIEFPITNLKGESIKGNYPVWVRFFDDYYDKNDVDFKGYYFHTRNNTSQALDLITCSTKYPAFVESEILKNILELKEKYNNIQIIWGNSKKRNHNKINEYHFSFLKNELNRNQIPFENLSKLNSLLFIKDNPVIAVIEVVSDNEQIKQNCTSIIEKIGYRKPLIVYYSLLKKYDFNEMQELINLEIQKEKEKDWEEECRRQKEERKRLEEERKQKELRDIKSCVSSWHHPYRSCLNCFSLYNYYPTTCDWEASEDEWDVRKTIWDFKAKPHGYESEATTIRKHKTALEKVLPNLQKVINHFFGSKKSKLTLVCIPASTKKVTELRYRDLCERLCSATGISNGYDYVNVTKDGISKNDPDNTTGHSMPAEVRINSAFFSGRYVLLFDDVITTGGSIEEFKNKMESAGATVIGGLSIGKTKHDRQDANPIENI